MRLTFTLSLALTVIALALPSAAEACACVLGSTLPGSFERSELVFVGTVVRPDGARLGRAIEGEKSRWLLAFNVTRQLKGKVGNHVAFVNSSNTCSLPFNLGQTWIVYASFEDGLVRTTTCERTRLLAHAGQDIAFIEGLSQRRPQGVVSGEVLRRIPATGQLSSRPPYETARIVAEGKAGKVEVEIDRWGSYDLVLPPGDFEVWAELDGRIVTDRAPIHINDGSDLRLDLIVEHTEGLVQQQPDAALLHPDAIIERAQNYLGPGPDIARRRVRLRAGVFTVQHVRDIPRQFRGNGARRMHADNHRRSQQDPR